MKRIFLMVSCFFIYFNVFSQDFNKKIYFLADTTSISKGNKFLEIKLVDFFEKHFVFFCKCAPPYKSYVTFSYINKKGVPIAEVVSKKPDYPYISFKELMDMSGEWYNNFDNKYDLYITEVLPGNKYRTNKVRFVLYSQPVNNGVVLKKQ